MNKNFSEEIIEIDGKEYTLFLNRLGIVAWEKTTKFSKFQEMLNKKYGDIENLDNIGNVEVSDDSKPNELFGEFEDIDNDEIELRNSVITFYWIALGKYHNLSFAEAKELMEKAENGTFDETGKSNNDAYGIDQLTALMIQMIEEANTSTIQTNELKNLKALKPTK